MWHFSRTTADFLQKNVQLHGELDVCRVVGDVEWAALVYARTRIPGINCGMVDLDIDAACAVLMTCVLAPPFLSNLTAPQPSASPARPAVPVPQGCPASSSGPLAASHRDSSCRSCTHDLR
eukprot:1135948-Rhodomonas_salina.4